MKTIGMMGEVVGKAAAVAIQRNTTPRGVYEQHWKEVDSLLKLPGRARRASLEAPFQISGPAPEPLDDSGGRGAALSALKGIVIDNKAAKLTGSWTSGTNLEHVGPDYIYARGAGHKASFAFTVPSDGRYEVRFATAPHENRASNTALIVRHADGAAAVTVNQRKPATLDKQWVTLGIYRFTAGQPAAVEVDATNADGNVHLDGVQLLPAK
jgi:hypothetical protein